MQPQDFYEFSGFRLDIKKNRLTRGGEIIPLTPKEFDLLFFLIENSGRTVEKDELLNTVWKDTFVEEGTLTRNISWLRKKLAAHDDQKIIETLPKRGYRFLPEITPSANDLIVEEQIIRQIEIEQVIEIIPSPAERQIVPGKFFVADVGNAAELNSPALPAAPVERRLSAVWIFPVSLSVLAIAALAFYLGYFSPKQTNVILAAKIAPFSGLPGREDSPAFSPDGRQMVFVWDGGIENGNTDVYVKLLGAGEPVRLTNSETDETKPIFSPDGKSICFVRIFPTHNEIVSIPALGGAERVIYDKASYASISFAPDGKSIAAAELDLASGATGIFTIDVQTGAKNRITMPAAPAVDHTPRFSPDGKSLAFVRYFSSFKRELFVVAASGGEPRQITSDDARIYGLAWSADSRDLFFISFRQVDQLNLWKISPNERHEPQMISIGGKNLNDLAISPDGKIVAFTEEAADENIWEIAPDQNPRVLIRSTRADHSQQFSPDGKQIVFASDRTGNYEIWMADADGKNQGQLTDGDGSAGSPRFSPDGKSIVYDAQTAGNSAIYAVSTNGGAPVRLTADEFNNALPAWSADGQWIFFLSNRSGAEQIWKIPASGGAAVQITQNGAFEIYAAPDNKTIVYSKGAGKFGLWTIGVDGGDEKPIPELNEAGAWRSWTIAGDEIYFINYGTQPPFKLKSFDLATGKTKEITNIKKPPLAYYSNIAVSPDGKRILYAQQDQNASSIMLAELK